MSNRFRTANAEALVSFLRASGLDPEARVAPAESGWHGSPLTAHPARDGFLSVRTVLTNSQLHRFAVQMGVVAPVSRAMREREQDRFDHLDLLSRSE